MYLIHRTTLMKRFHIPQFVKSITALMFPWLILLIDDNPGGAFIALVLQATLIGWPFAAIWAWQIVHDTKKKKTHSA